MARRIETGKAAKLEGLKELQANLRDIMDATVGLEARKVVGEAAEDLRRDVAARIMVMPSPRSLTASRGLRPTIGPQQVLESLYSYNKQPPGARKEKLTALVGIRKRGRSHAPAYVEWRAGKHPKSDRSKRAPGELVGESLGTMWELGTSKRPATPFFRPAIQAARARIIETIAAGYRAILAKHSK